MTWTPSENDNQQEMTTKGIEMSFDDRYSEFCGACKNQLKYTGQPQTCCGKKTITINTQVRETLEKMIERWEINNGIK